MTAHYQTSKWIGKLFYGKEYGIYQGKELVFEMEITHDQDKIEGTAIDISGTGINPEPAKIFGVFKEDSITFLKQYPSYHYFENDVIQIDNSIPGPRIQYWGTYNNTNSSFQGNWQMREKYYILGFIPISRKSTGTWTMKRK